jgi:hypothetical protein
MTGNSGTGMRCTVDPNTDIIGWLFFLLIAIFILWLFWEMEKAINRK